MRRSLKFVVLLSLVFGITLSGCSAELSKSAEQTDKEEYEAIRWSGNPNGVNMVDAILANRFKSVDMLIRVPSSKFYEAVGEDTKAVTKELSADEFGEMITETQARAVACVLADHPDYRVKYEMKPFGYWDHQGDTLIIMGDSPLERNWGYESYRKIEDYRYSAYDAPYVMRTDCTGVVNTTPSAEDVPLNTRWDNEVRYG